MVKHRNRHHEGPWLIERKLYSISFHGHRSADPRKRGKEQRETCGIQALQGARVPEQDQERGREKEKTWERHRTHQ